MADTHVFTPPHNNSSCNTVHSSRHEVVAQSGHKAERNSNLELYRIIVMLLIIIHHYVVNSGLVNEAISLSPLTPSSITMLILGGWGKTGINCFIMITGYFMCKSKISGIKLIRLYIQIVFYAVIIYIIFCFTGHERFSIFRAAALFLPFRDIRSSFVDCFLIFYLFIPFLNIILRNLDKKKHLVLICLLLTVYSLLPSIPVFRMYFNYVSWFMAIYIMAAYIRFYGLFPHISHAIWGWITVGLILLGSISILGMTYLSYTGVIKFFPYFFVTDSNKLLAILPAISSFMFFKDLRIPHSRFINALGAATFGVLLIHANSNAMRQWLWRDTVDCIGHFGESVLWTAGYSIITVLIVFFICAGIEWFRARYIERHYMNYLRRKFPHLN